MALFFADLHLHSKYSRAVSPRMDLEHLDEGAKKKGLRILGSGDFSHPKWFAELKSKLEQAEGNAGLFNLKGSRNNVFFILQNEIATIISTPKGVKKVHHVVLASDLEVVAQLNDRLGGMGNLSADGRPIFGSTSPAHLVEICKEVSKEIEIIPAHAWTPWFGVFGSNSGFNSIKEAYEEQAKHIFALETGMSSDPAMNWRLSQLDGFALVSNSDSHSPHPYRIGRECNAFEFEEEKLNYGNLINAIKEKDRTHFKFTVEVDPNYGKYHFDGHRNCNFSCGPEESGKLKGICPVCKSKMTIGVLSRVEELADRKEGFVPKDAIPYKTLLPLQDLVASCFAVPAMSRKAYAETERLMARFGNEFEILLNADEAKLKTEMHGKLAAAILANREGKLKVKAGFDGEYGILQLGKDMIATEEGKTEAEVGGEKNPPTQSSFRKSVGGQKDLSEFF
ncbi:MAG: endonuclease Q family protein [Candidatus Micrarchaeota archaeon]